MKKFKILIVEDDNLIAESLQDIILALDHEVAGIAGNAKSAMEMIQLEKPDLALLDIQINGSIDGLELADMIKAESDIPFIFTTAFADTSTLEKAKELGPFGYIVKPYGIKDVNAAIQIAMSNHSSVQSLKKTSDQAMLKNNHLFVKADSRLIKIKDDEILYVEAKGDYAIFKTSSKSYVVHSTMKNIENKLSSRNFVKVHRSFIVNLDKIVDIEDTNLLINDKIIPISRSNKNALMDRINLI
ncbi:response regulator [Hyphobacterium sp. CCMP332]|nr:response regulator [Hyphobacterium sp. CCMP332]